jgi:hypothetical protein
MEIYGDCISAVPAFSIRQTSKGEQNQVWSRLHSTDKSAYSKHVKGIYIGTNTMNLWKKQRAQICQSTILPKEIYRFQLVFHIPLLLHCTHLRIGAHKFSEDEKLRSANVEQQKFKYAW